MGEDGLGWAGLLFVEGLEMFVYIYLRKMLDAVAYVLLCNKSTLRLPYQ
jgi:hypothetical protein